mmetsp:Transcript_29778/g.62630  ORF Transcript_29778/g.62630 Transcript_29778/m.62630 type:complete len:847 (+) Transcript_29778:202-2742(+)
MVFSTSLRSSFSRSGRASAKVPLSRPKDVKTPDNESNCDALDAYYVDSRDERSFGSTSAGSSRFDGSAASSYDDDWSRAESSAFFSADASSYFSRDEGHSYFSRDNGGSAYSRDDASSYPDDETEFEKKKSTDEKVDGDVETAAIEVDIENNTVSYFQRAFSNFSFISEVGQEVELDSASVTYYTSDTAINTKSTNETAGNTDCTDNTPAKTNHTTDTAENTEDTNYDTEVTNDSPNENEQSVADKNTVPILSGDKVYEPKPVKTFGESVSYGGNSASGVASSSASAGAFAGNGSSSGSRPSLSFFKKKPKSILNPITQSKSGKNTRPAQLLPVLKESQDSKKWISFDSNEGRVSQSNHGKKTRSKQLSPRTFERHSSKNSRSIGGRSKSVERRTVTDNSVGHVGTHKRSKSLERRNPESSIVEDGRDDREKLRHNMPMTSNLKNGTTSQATTGLKSILLASKYQNNFSTMGSHRLDSFRQNESYQKKRLIAPQKLVPVNRTISQNESAQVLSIDRAGQTVPNTAHRKEKLSKQYNSSAGNIIGVPMTKSKSSSSIDPIDVDFVSAASTGLIDTDDYTEVTDACPGPTAAAPFLSILTRGLCPNRFKSNEVELMSPVYEGDQQENLHSNTSGIEQEASFGIIRHWLGSGADKDPESTNPDSSTTQSPESGPEEMDLAEMIFQRAGIISVGTELDEELVSTYSKGANSLIDNGTAFDDDDDNDEEEDAEGNHHNDQKKLGMLKGLFFSFRRKLKRSDSEEDAQVYPIIGSDTFMANVMNELNLENVVENETGFGVSNLIDVDELSHRDDNLPDGFEEMLLEMIAEEAVLGCLESDKKKFFPSLRRKK